MSCRLEKYYVDAVQRSDLTAVALAEAIKPVTSTGTHVNLAANALHKDVREHLRKRAIYALVQDLMGIDPHYPSDACPRDLYNYKRRVRRCAEKSLFCEEAEKQRKSLTLVDQSKRYEELKKSGLMDRIMELAQEQLHQVHKESAIDDHPYTMSYFTQVATR